LVEYGRLESAYFANDPSGALLLRCNPPNQNYGNACKGSKPEIFDGLGHGPLTSVDVGGSIPSPPTTAGSRHTRVSSI